MITASCSLVAVVRSHLSSSPDAAVQCWRVTAITTLQAWLKRMWTSLVARSPGAIGSRPQVAWLSPVSAPSLPHSVACSHAASFSRILNDILTSNISRSSSLFAWTTSL